MVHHARTHQPVPATRGLTLHQPRLYDALLGPATLWRTRRLRAETVDLARVMPGHSVLDVGCGTGDLCLAVKARVGAPGRVVGLDASPEMLEAARRKARRAGELVEFHQGAAEAMPLPDGSFDVVPSSFVMHHLPQALKRKVLEEMRRVLKPGGRLAVADVAPPTTVWGRVIAATLLHGAVSEGLRELPLLFREAGFGGIETGAMGFGTLGFVIGHRTA